MKTPLVIYWARRDLRITDNPALESALRKSKETGAQFVPLFILEDYMTEGDPEYQFGYPSRFFLAKALPLFAEKFTTFLIVCGKGAQYFKKLGEDFELTIFVNDDIYPDFYTQVKKIEEEGTNIMVLPDALTVSKEVRTGDGNVYSVFTPFKKAVWGEFVSDRSIQKADLGSVTYPSREVLDLFPNRVDTNTESLTPCFSKKRTCAVGGTVIDIDVYHELPQLNDWYTSEDEAIARFKAYLKAGFLDSYKENRDSLEKDTEVVTLGGVSLGGKTSKKSLALAWGMVSSRTLVKMIKDHFDEPFDNPFSNRVSVGALTYISELIWREFYRYLLFHKPNLMDTEFQVKFRGTIEWLPHDEAMKRFILWIKGETGYPVVDAAMHQIAKTGWMHNRARMIVASILTKNLGVDWRWGQEYFRASLIDLDEASNNGGWQWGASVGADPKPIRIFNPELQAKNYDASGAYVNGWLHNAGALLKAETIPIIEHKLAREEALHRYKLGSIKSRDY